MKCCEKNRNLFYIFAHTYIMLSMCQTLFRGLTHLILNSYGIGTVIIPILQIWKQMYREVTFNITSLWVAKSRLECTWIYRYIVKQIHKISTLRPVCCIPFLSSETVPLFLPLSLSFLEKFSLLLCDLSGSWCHLKKRFYLSDIEKKKHKQGEW